MIRLLKRAIIKITVAIMYFRLGNVPGRTPRGISRRVTLITKIAKLEKLL